MKGLVIFIGGVVVGLILGNTSVSEPACNITEGSGWSAKKRECTPEERERILKGKEAGNAD